MNRKNCRILLGFILIITGFLGPAIVEAAEELSVTNLWDTSFYGSYCQDDWSWLCQTSQPMTSSLNRIDGWDYFSQGFFNGQDGEKELVFTFSSPDQTPWPTYLLVDLKSATKAIGVINLWFDWGQGWQKFNNQQGENKLIFGPDSYESIKINLAESLPTSFLTSNNNWQLKILTSPLIGSEPVMLALDRVLITDDVEVLPTLTPTPTPATVDSNIQVEFLEPESRGKVYFNEVVNLSIKVMSDLPLDKVVLQTSTDNFTWKDVVSKESNFLTLYWSPVWFPQEEGSYYLRVKAYDEEGNFGLVSHPDLFIFDQTGPTIDWLSPQSDDQLLAYQPISLAISDDLSGVEEEVRLSFAHQNSSWQLIESLPWDTSKLALGDYQLQAVVADRAGNLTSSKINLVKEISVFNIFLVDGQLSWQTDWPTQCRLLYGPVALSADQLSFDKLNFGYSWASALISPANDGFYYYDLSNLPPADYFARVIISSDRPIYSQEFAFTSQNFWPPSQEDFNNQDLILGDSQEKETAQVSPSLASEDAYLPRLNWLRIVVILVLAFLSGGLLVHFLVKKT